MGISISAALFHSYLTDKLDMLYIICILISEVIVPHSITLSESPHLWACWHFSFLTHWGRVTHICVSKPTIIDSDNGLSPGRRQAIIWTNAGILLIWPLGTNFSEILIEIDIFLFKKMHLKVSSEKLRPFCLSLNVLILMISRCTVSLVKPHSSSRVWKHG